MNAAQHILIFAVRGYRVIISPVLTGLFSPLGLGCRFDPTCSQYALDAVVRHGALRGAALAARRLARCHPWGGYGIDPVPPRAVPGPRRVHSHPPETGCASLTAAQPPELRQSH